MPIDKNKISNQELLIKTATTVELLNTRLFGGEGQVGALPYILEKHEDLVQKLDVNKKELLDKIEAKKAETDKDIEDIREEHHKLDVKINWFAGGLAALGSAATFVTAWMGLHHKVIK